MTVTIERVAALGRGVARTEGLTVLVARGVPGETVQVEVEKVFPRYALARVVAVSHPAPERVPPPCPHFETCGGCDWQHVSYATQLAYKRQVFEDQLQRIGGLESPSDWVLTAAEPSLSYRDKLEFTPAAGAQGWEPGFHPWVGTTPLPITYCRLAPEAYTGLARAALTTLAGLGLLRPPQETPPDPVPVRRLTVQGTEDLPGRTGLALVLHLRDAATLHRYQQAGEALVGALRAGSPLLASLMLTAPRHGRADASVTVYGAPWVFKQINGQRYRAPLTGFFQVHPAQAARLVRHVVEGVSAFLEEVEPPAERGEEPGWIWDLYCGVGLFALPLARAGHRVVGLDVDRQGVRAARETARETGADVTFEAVDLEHAHGVRHLRPRKAPAVVIVDPPRRGLSAALCRTLLEIAPPLLVYVSCDGGSFARDAARLAPRYRLQALRGFDLFPQTHHLEVVGMFRRISV